MPAAAEMRIVSDEALPSVFAGWLGLGMAASTSALATERAAVAALGLWSIHAEMAAPS